MKLALGSISLTSSNLFSISTKFHENHQIVSLKLRLLCITLNSYDWKATLKHNWIVFYAYKHGCLYIFLLCKHGYLYELNMGVTVNYCWFRACFGCCLTLSLRCAPKCGIAGEFWLIMHHSASSGKVVNILTDWNYYI